MSAEGTRIVQRGLVMFALVGAMAVAVLIILLRQPPAAEKAITSPARPLSLTMVANTGFPAALPWGALASLNDEAPSPPGWEIRYTATRVLAHRGSSKVPVAVLCEMLDEQRQSRNFQARLADGNVVPDEGAAAQELVIALKSVSEWLKKQTEAGTSFDRAGLNKLFHAVDKLTHSGNNVVRTRAKETLLAFKR